MEIRRLVSGADGRSELLPMEVYFDDDEADRLPATAVTLVRRQAARVWAPSPARALVVCLSGSTRVTDGHGTSVEFGPGDLFLRDDTSGEGHGEQYFDEVFHLVLHCPDYDPPALTSGLACWAQEPVLRGKFGPPTLSRIFSHGEETSFAPLVWPGDLRAEEGPVEEWQPVACGRFVDHAGIAVGRWEPGDVEPKPTSIGWHQTRQRCLHIVLTGQARTHVTNGSSVLRQQGDVQLAEDLTGKGHFNMFSGRGAGLVVFLPDDSFVERTTWESEVSGAMR